MKRVSLCLACIVFARMSSPLPVLAQGGGDQFLDGIGETALVARYVFDGNAQDASRNTHHATIRGAGAGYIEDARFGRVLSLPGGNGAYVRIPGRALDGLDAVSVAGWVRLRSADPAPLFDFGVSDTSRFCGVSGGADGYRAGITRTGAAGLQVPAAPSLSANRWAHVAVVLDAARGILRCYLDGANVGQVADVGLALEQVLDPENADASRLYIGRTQDGDAPRLHALLHDWRLYSVALTDDQVAVIHTNARTGGGAAVAAAAEEPTPAAAPARGIAQPMASLLIGVPDVAVETETGRLPRLPYRIPGIYPDDAQGPDVRVIWPSPTNNQATLTTGAYTVVGRVPGTPFQPTATVTVKAPAGEPTPPARQLESFPLGSVTLIRDRQQRDTPFIKNRDKFLRGLADTNPDRFLYMFRDAFGQPQPEGAEPLRGWDDQTTRLRGHATGHYLSAIAQAYAQRHLRRTAPRKLPAEDGVSDRCSVRPVAKVGEAHRRGGALPCRSHDRSARTRQSGLRFRSGRGRHPHRLLELGRRVHQRVSSRPVHHAGTGRHLRRTQTRSGPHTTRCTKSWPACSTVTKWAGTQRPWKSPKAWARWVHQRLRVVPTKRASACGTDTSPANTAA
jgi:uncharacterized protein